VRWSEAVVRVVHNVGHWLPGGAFWLYGGVVGALDQVEPHVVCDVSENLDIFPVPRLYVASRRPLAFQVDRVLKKLSVRRHRSLLAEVLKATSAPILHSHFGQTGWANAGFAYQEGIRHLVSCYGEDVTRFPTSSATWRRRYAEMFSVVDVILCEGPYMAATVERLGCPPAKIRTHPLGVDLGSIAFHPRRPDAGEPVRLLMAAAFREKKGLSYAARALGMLARRGIPFEATIVGDVRPGDDSREKREILAALECFGIRDRVRLRGWLTHEELLEQAFAHHLFVSPSVTAADGDAEGGAPVAVIEMAASGMPIVATTHCDIPSVLAEPNRQLLAPERDSEALADAVESLLALDDWEPLVRANRAWIEERHDTRRQALKLVDLYRELEA
jgi:colanic acid/amylovoran/stewartan biosynthesis glycosyltransferase WcaL/AmsK/CpsK